MKKREGSKEEEEAMKIWDCGSPLYDSYELVSLGHVIDRHIMKLPFGGSSRRLPNQPYHAFTVIPSTEDKRVSGKAKGSRMVSCFSQTLEKSMWKRKVNQERQEKPKKVKSGFYRICNRIGSWRK